MTDFSDWTDDEIRKELAPWTELCEPFRTSDAILLAELSALELGLRWLNDRSQDDKRRNKSRAWQDPSGRWFG